MTDPDPDTSFYAAIEAALVRSGRGRAFLVEHARRSRAADTATLLDAVARLEARIGRDRAIGNVERLRSELADMTDIMRRARAGLAPGVPAVADPVRLGAAAGPLDAVAAEATAAAAAIVDATEKIQEAAWTMREAGSDPALCDSLDSHATEIYGACALGEAATRSMARAGQTLDLLAERLEAMNRVWGARHSGEDRLVPLEETPLVLSNEDIDFVVVDDGAEPPPRRTIPVPAAGEPSREPDAARAAALAELRRLGALGTRDTLRLFS